jgi:hypothetical protein
METRTDCIVNIPLLKSRFLRLLEEKKRVLVRILLAVVILECLALIVLSYLRGNFDTSQIPAHAVTIILGCIAILISYLDKRLSTAMTLGIMFLIFVVTTTITSLMLLR